MLRRVRVALTIGIAVTPGRSTRRLPGCKQRRWPGEARHQCDDIVPPKSYLDRLSAAAFLGWCVGALRHSMPACAIFATTRSVSIVARQLIWKPERRLQCREALRDPFNRHDVNLIAELEDPVDRAILVFIAITY